MDIYQADKHCPAYKTYDQLVSLLFGQLKGGIKAHVSLGEAMMLPGLVHITEAGVSGRRGVDNFRYGADTIVVDDRGYFDFKLFMQRIADKNHFVTGLAAQKAGLSGIKLRRTSVWTLCNPDPHLFNALYRLRLCS